MTGPPWSVGWPTARAPGGRRARPPAGSVTGNIRKRPSLSRLTETAELLLYCTRD